jgi:PTH1 family peptidyl-tRNA hydrolase
VDKEPKLIVGLGNPGEEYRNTRHNAGFMILAVLADKHRLEDPKRSGPCLVTKARLEGQKLIMVWPQTYMNNCGPAVRRLVDFYKVPAGRILVLHDELDLPLGRIRFSKGGSSGGHKGLESIMSEISAPFDRLRFGIGRPPKDGFITKIIDYVLSPFSSLEDEKVDKTLAWSADLVRIWAVKNLAAAQMLGNRTERAPAKKPKPKTEDGENKEAAPPAGGAAPEAPAVSAPASEAPAVSAPAPEAPAVSAPAPDAPAVSAPAPEASRV